VAEFVMSVILRKSRRCDIGNMKYMMSALLFTLVFLSKLYDIKYKTIF